MALTMKNLIGGTGYAYNGAQTRMMDFGSGAANMIVNGKSLRPTPIKYAWQEIFTVFQYSTEEAALYEVNSRRTKTAVTTCQVGLGLKYYSRNALTSAAQEFSIGYVDTLPEISDADVDSLYKLNSTGKIYRLVKEDETATLTIDASNPFPAGTIYYCGQTIPIAENRAVSLWPSDDAQSFFEIDTYLVPSTAPTTVGEFEVQLYYTDADSGIQSPLCKITLTATAVPLHTITIHDQAPGSSTHKFGWSTDLVITDVPVGTTWDAFLADPRPRYYDHEGSQVSLFVTTDVSEQPIILVGFRSYGYAMADSTYTRVSPTAIASNYDEVWLYV